jgi:hypothetical protein
VMRMIYPITISAVRGVGISGTRDILSHAMVAAKHSSHEGINIQDIGENICHLSERERKKKLFYFLDLQNIVRLMPINQGEDQVIFIQN